MALCLKCIHSKYFKNYITGTCFNMKKYNVPLELVSVRPFSIQIHINVKFMSSQGNVKGRVFQIQAWRPLILMFYFDSLS